MRNATETKESCCSFVPFFRLHFASSYSFPFWVIPLASNNFLATLMAVLFSPFPPQESAWSRWETPWTSSSSSPSSRPSSWPSSSSASAACSSAGGRRPKRPTRNVSANSRRVSFSRFWIVDYFSRSLSFWTCCFLDRSSLILTLWRLKYPLVECPTYVERAKNRNLKKLVWQASVILQSLNHAY